MVDCSVTIERFGTGSTRTMLLLLTPLFSNPDTDVGVANTEKYRMVGISDRRFSRNYFDCYVSAVVTV